MQNTIVRTAAAPAVLGPYSQAVIVPTGDRKLIFCCGQIALEPTTGAMVTGGVEVETRQTLANLGAVLSAAGASWKDVVKTTIFLASMDDYAAVNAIYGEKFPHDPPARAAVQVARLPRDARVEIDAMAVI